MDYQTYETSRTQSLAASLNSSQPSPLMKYPSDLGQGEQQNYIFFQIKVPKASRYFSDNRSNSVDTNNSSASSQDFLGRTLSNGLTSSTGYQGGYSDFFIQQSIALYMPPEGLKSTDRQQWETVDFGMFGTVANMVTAAADGTMNAAQYGESLKTLLQGSTTSAISALGIPVKEMLEKRGNYALNPHVELLYKGVGHREHQFSFLLFAKSEAETRTIDNIVKTFRYHQAPEFTGVGNGFFIYPSVFDIGFYSGNRLNTFLPKITTSAMTSIQVEYGGIGGEFKTFMNDAPNVVQISMTFQELEIITKEKIEQGF